MFLSRLAHFFVSIFLCCFNGKIVWAETVTLTSLSGGFKIEGDLIEADAHLFTLETDFGEVTLNRDKVTCTSEACPDHHQSSVLLSADPTFIERFLLPQFQAFVRHKNLNVQELYSSDGIDLILSTKTGNEIVIFTLKSSSTDDAIRDLIAGTADVAISDRPLNEEERSMIEVTSFGQVKSKVGQYLLAKDALVLVKNPQSTTNDLTLSTLLELIEAHFLSSKNSKPDFTLYLSGSLSVLENFTRTGKDMNKKDILADIDTLRQFIEKDATGIGIVPKSIAQGLQIHEFYDRCGEYIHVNARTIETGDYPFSFSLFAFTSPSPLPEMARSFFEFLSSPMGQMVAERTGYVRTSSRPQPFVEQGGRLSHALINASSDVTISDLKDMVRNLKPKKRLSTTFRFLNGNLELDQNSKAMLLRLASDIRSGDYRNTKLSLVGFSDSDGSAQTNLSISLIRAEYVKEALFTLLEPEDPLRETIETLTFGEVLPITCDNSSLGQKTNRRVEVWVE